MLVKIHNIGHSINSGRLKYGADKPRNPSPPSTVYCARTVQTPSEKAKPRHVPKTRRNVGYFKDYRKKATNISSGSFHRFVSKNWVVGVDA